MDLNENKRWIKLCKKIFCMKNKQKESHFKRNRTKIIYEKAVRQQLYRRYKFFDGKRIFR